MAEIHDSIGGLIQAKVTSLCEQSEYGCPRFGIEILFTSEL
jgi:hypothetical protein